MSKKIVENMEGGAVDNTAPQTEDKAEKDIKDLMKLTLGQPYKYDGDEIKEIDLSGLLDLNARDLVEIDKEMTRQGFTGSRIELTRQYAMLVAAKVADKPYNFCDRMSARDSIRLKEYVTTFLYATA